MYWDMASFRFENLPFWILILLVNWRRIPTVGNTPWGGGATPRKIGWGCAAKSHTLFMTKMAKIS